MKYLVKKELEIRSQPSLEQGQVLGVLNPGFILDATDALDEENAWLRDNNGHFYWKGFVEEAILKISNDFELNLNLKADWLSGNFDISSFWKLTTGRGITIAVLDSGITFHEDLVDNIDRDRLKSFIGDSVVDTNGHGTHVAGIIGATGKKQLVGVAPQVKILPIKIAESHESKIDNNVLIKSLKYISKFDDVKIINLSFSANFDQTHIELDLIIQELIQNGKIVVAAAGNDWGNFVSYPAYLDNVIAVGALQRVPNTQEMYQLMNQSNFGKRVDICSIGYNIFSCHSQFGPTFRSGTSMATAYISGLIALKFQLWADNLKSYSRARLIDDFRSSIYGYATRHDKAASLPIINPRIFLTN